MRKPVRALNRRQILKIRELLDTEHDVESRGKPLERAEFRFHKWQFIHKTIHDHPFSVRMNQPRAEQWREALNIIRDIGEMELIDWVLLQVEVAQNLSNGIQDMRPRKGGQCHPLLLEYTGNRKRHALAVLHFAREGEKEGLYTVNSNWHSRTEHILKNKTGCQGRGNGGHEDMPWDVPE